MQCPTCGSSFLSFSSSTITASPKPKPVQGWSCRAAQAGQGGSNLEDAGVQMSGILICWLYSCVSQVSCLAHLARRPCAPRCAKTTQQNHTLQRSPFYHLAAKGAQQAVVSAAAADRAQRAGAVKAFKHHACRKCKADGQPKSFEERAGEPAWQVGNEPGCRQERSKSGKAHAWKLPVEHCPSIAPPV